MTKPKIFISYSHHDEEWKDRLIPFLKVLQIEGRFDIWQDRQIGAGQEWRQQIEKAIEEAKLALLLVSADFLVSDFIRDEEIPRLLELREQRGLHIVPIILRPCPWETVPWLARLQAHPTGGRELSSGTDHQIEKDLTAIAKEIDDILTPVSEPSPVNSELTDELIARIEQTKLARPDLIEQVTTLVRSDKAVAMLAPRKGGNRAFIRQLLVHLQETQPDWETRMVAAEALAGETVKQYLARMRELMGVDNDNTGRLVVCIHGWLNKLDEHQDALGRELRVYMENGLANRRPFSLVAVGGYPLFLLRYGDGQMSVLNRAEQIDMPDFDAGQIHALMEQIDTGRWNRQDADEVCHRSGGHPYLIKLLLKAWLNDPAAGWTVAEEALEEDTNYLLPRLANAWSDDKTRKQLKRCLDTPEGIRYSVVNPHSPSLALYYDGLLRRERKKLLFRCDVVRRLAEEAFEEH